MYANRVKTRVSAQGGPVHQLSHWDILRNRFLILGVEGSQVDVRKASALQENATALRACLAEDGSRVIDMVLEVSEKGLAPSQDPGLYALALASGHSDQAVRRKALQVLPRVARTGSTLFQFVREIKDGNIRGWGRALRNAVLNWYTSKTPDQLAYQAVKYRQRHGFTHRDLLRLAGGGRSGVQYSEDMESVLRWIVNPENFGARAISRNGEGVTYEEVSREVLPRIITGFEAAQAASTTSEMVKAIHQFGLTHEMVPNEFKGKAEVWDALLQDMPMGALLRNLGRMSNLGILEPFSDNEKMIVSRFQDEAQVKRSRLHPMAILKAQRTYRQGRGQKGKLTWTPNSNVEAAMEPAFYHGFQNVTPSGKNIMVNIDASGSMCSQVDGMAGLTCRELAAVMAMAVARTEPASHFAAFGSEMIPLDISKTDNLQTVLRKTDRLPWQGTNCGKPMQHALRKGWNVDAFVVYTDNDTGHGTDPCRDLRTFREKVNSEAKLVVAAMQPWPYTIADPNDIGMLDIAGFDTSTPAVISAFARG